MQSNLSTNVGETEEHLLINLLCTRPFAHCAKLVGEIDSWGPFPFSLSVPVVAGQEPPTLSLWSKCSATVLPLLANDLNN
jgi:hypothetical protein